MELPHIGLLAVVPPAHRMVCMMTNLNIAYMHMRQQLAAVCGFEYE